MEYYNELAIEPEKMEYLDRILRYKHLDYVKDEDEPGTLPDDNIPEVQEYEAAVAKYEKEALFRQEVPFENGNYAAVSVIAPTSPLYNDTHVEVQLFSASGEEIQKFFAIHLKDMNWELTDKQGNSYNLAACTKTASVELTEEGRERVDQYLQELQTERKEILDAGMDTADETSLPSYEDILMDIDNYEEENEYMGAWPVSDNTLADTSLYLERDRDYVNRPWEPKWEKQATEALIDAGEWHLNKKAIQDLSLVNPPDNDVNLGSVYFGNRCFKYYASQYKGEFGIYIEEYMPTKEERDPAFLNSIKNAQKLTNVRVDTYQPSSAPFKHLDASILTDLHSFQKAAIKESLVDRDFTPEVIATYKKIKESGQGFYQRCDRLYQELSQRKKSVQVSHQLQEECCSECYGLLNQMEKKGLSAKDVLKIHEVGCQGTRDSQPAEYIPLNLLTLPHA